MFELDRRNFLRLSAASALDRLFAADHLKALVTSASDPIAAAVERLSAMTAVALPGWKTRPDDIPHPEDPQLSDSGWSAYAPPEPTGPTAFFRPDARNHPGAAVGTGRVWFRKLVTTPRAMGGYDITGLPLRLNLRVFYQDFWSQQASVGNIRVFSNGTLIEMTAARSQEPILLTKRAQPGQQFLIAAYSPMPSGLYARLEVDYPIGKSNPFTFLQEILCVQAASKGFPEGQVQRAAQLLAAVSTIDFAALDRGSQAVFDRSLTLADARMRPLAEWIRQFSIYAVGNAHIDMGYLWPGPETVETVRDTFATVLELIAEYPGLTYAQSTSQDFLWLEKYYPPEFREIQQRVKDGRWELVGGMWVEPDLNIPCGESIVRQLLTGKRYFERAFGVDITIGWNPDSFGYSWQLPQIYKKSGIDKFVTQKMSWNDTTRFPHSLFWWSSPDGSRILTYFPHHYANDVNPVQCAQFIADDTAYCSGFPKQLLLFGLGDHGGGPTREMLDAAERWMRSPSAAFPNFRFSTVREYFNEVESALTAKTLALPTWNNEMYLENHRGTYTTQAETKKRMRETEVLILNTEKLCTLAMLYGRDYPQATFEDCWRRLCFDQFHDFITGCQIHVNYADAAENLTFVRNALLPELTGSLAHLAVTVDTSAPGRPIVTFNTLSWQRTSVTEAEVQFAESISAVEVRDPTGVIVPSHIVAHDPVTSTVRLRFLARSVPAFGYKVFHAVAVTAPTPAPTTLQASGLTLENEFLRLTVDHATGCITELLAKDDGRSILADSGRGNLLEIFADNPKLYDNCNLGWPYEQAKVEILHADAVELIENTAVRALIRVRKSFQGSTFVQDICLYPEIPRADVQMHVEWHEQHIMLKVAFPLRIAPERASYEIPYGSIERPCTYHALQQPKSPANDAAAAEYEVCAQQWGDLSDEGHGFSLLNACKYGYDTVEPGTLRLTLLRSPIAPIPSKDENDLFADQGPHDFTYSLYPHKGGWRDADTQRQGEELNFPLLVFSAEPHPGPMPSSRSMIAIAPADVILTALKRAEDDSSVIVRFYEFAGRDGQATLTLPEAATAASVTSLMEKHDTALPLATDGRSFTVPIGRYEIQSIRVSFADVAGTVPPVRI